MLPIKIFTSDKRKFQEISKIVDHSEFQEEFLRLAKKWRGKTIESLDEDYQKDILGSLSKLKLPNSLYDLLSDCVISGILWKNYNLSGTEILEILLVRSRKSKTLTDFPRDRDWYWRHKFGEGYGAIAKRDDVGKHMVLNAIKRYKTMTGNG